jgi:hypothetical protein
VKSEIEEWMRAQMKRREDAFGNVVEGGD